MNYYEHHLGDYLRDTAHLSMVEDGAYRRLLDAYYIKELPLPKAVRDVYRLVRAGTKVEKDAVSIVLSEFFSEGTDGWRHKRCDTEIARYQDKQAKAKRSAEARWGASKPHSDGNANASPNADANGMRTHSDGNALQTPDTRHQTPRREAKASSSAAKLPTCPTQAIIDIYHEVLPNLPKVRLHTKDRVKAIRKVWEWVLTSCKPDNSRRAETAEQALAWLRSYFERATENDFLMGRTPRSGEHANWQCDIDFLMTDRGMKQVIEKTKDSQ